MKRLFGRLAAVLALAAALVVAGGLPSLPVGARALAAEDEPSPEARGEHAVAEAEGEAHHGAEHKPEIQPGKLALQLLNFAVLLAILIKFAGGAMNKSFKARHEQLKAEVSAAAAARAAAEESLRKQEERLRGLEQEIASMRTGIKEEAEVEKARMIAAAEERAKRLKEETAFVIDQQTKEAQASLRREAAEAGVRIAEQLLAKSINASDQQRFLNGFVDDIARETVPGGKPPAGAGKAL
jgi:F-type H+-transporting ATPase subunit b